MLYRIFHLEYIFCVFQKTPRIIDNELLENIRKMPCFVCGKHGSESSPITPSHLQTRGSGGPDTMSNVVPMCIPCHSAWEHRRYMFSINRPDFMRKLNALGWEFADVFGVMKLRRITKQERE